MENTRHRISFVGAGNMAFRLSLALQEKGHTIEKICCRTAEKGEKLASILTSNGGETTYTPHYSDLLGSEVIILAVSDGSIAPVAEIFAQALRELPAEGEKPFFFHTSGATPLQALDPIAEAGGHIGVFYPMMTLTKGKNVNFAEVPLLLESEEPGCTGQLLRDLAFSLRSDYLECDSQRRLQMHCAAVFASNFVNYALSLAFELAGDKAPYLIPTAIEAVRKCCLTHPDLVQTGPALRGDMGTMTKHIEMLQKLGLQEHEEVYRLISKNIPQRVKKR